MKISELIRKLEYHFNTLKGEAIKDPAKARELRGTTISGIVNAQSFLNTDPWVRLFSIFFIQLPFRHAFPNHRMKHHSRSRRIIQRFLYAEKASPAAQARKPLKFFYHTDIVGK